jgi:hypothetical protein
MQTVADRPEAPTAIRTDLGAIFVSLELSDMADHVAVARRRREDVEASGAWWRCGRTTGAVCGSKITFGNIAVGRKSRQLSQKTPGSRCVLIPSLLS